MWGSKLKTKEDEPNDDMVGMATALVWTAWTGDGGKQWGEMRARPRSNLDELSSIVVLEPARTPTSTMSCATGDDCHSRPVEAESPSV